MSANTNRGTSSGTTGGAIASTALAPEAASKQQEEVPLAVSANVSQRIPPAAPPVVPQNVPSGIADLQRVKDGLPQTRAVIQIAQALANSAKVAARPRSKPGCDLRRLCVCQRENPESVARGRILRPAPERDRQRFPSARSLGGGRAFCDGGQGRRVSRWGRRFAARGSVRSVSAARQILEGGEFLPMLEPKVDQQLAGGFVEEAVLRSWGCHLSQILRIDRDRCEILTEMLPHQRLPPSHKHKHPGSMQESRKQDRRTNRSNAAERPGDAAH
jgi:hypothetical protein